MMLSLSTVSAQNDITVHDDSIGHDEEIELPEAMGLDIDTLLRQWNAEQYLLTDTDCRNQDVNPVFPDSIFIDGDALQHRRAQAHRPVHRPPAPLRELYAGRGKLLHADIRGGPLALQPAPRTQVPAHHRERPRPDGHKPQGSRGPLAVYAQDRQTLQSDRQQPRRRAPRPH